MSKPYLEVLDLPRDAVTLGQLAGAYTALRLVKSSPARRKNVMAKLRRFVAHFGADRPAAEIKPAHVEEWIGEWERRWKSAHTRRDAINSIRACYSWAVTNGLLSRNPAAAVRTETPEVTRLPITPDEFRRLLRGSGSHVRRLLLFLRLTGARPGEARAIRWGDVNLEKKLIVLRRHKAFRSTGAPRIFYLSEPLVKMFRWMQRHQRDGRKKVWTSHLLYELLIDGPVRASRVKRWRRAKRISIRALQRARERLGVRCVRSKWGTRYYKLPAGAVKPERTGSADFVFLNANGGPWKKVSLEQYIRRVCNRIGLPGVHMYKLRHGFCTEGLAGGVDLVMVSKMAGHKDIRVTQATYCHLDEKTDVLLKAANEVVKHLGLGGERAQAHRDGNGTPKEG